MLSRLGVRTTSSATGAACFELRVASTILGAWLKEIEVISAAATAQTFGLGEPAAIGVTPTTPVPLIPLDLQLPAPTTEGTSQSGSHVTTALAWGTPPTVPASFIARANLPATLGANIKWKFDGNGIWIPAGASIVLWGVSANIATDVNVLVDEVPA